MSAEAEPASPVRLRASIIVIASGIFVTGLAWPGILGALPFNLLLKNQLGAQAEDIATFWAVATFAWYIKPLVGLICDAYPLLGTRRRGYLLCGSATAGLLWLSFAFVPRTKPALLATLTALNLAMVFVATAVGGLQVEVAQRHRATGRLASLASAVEGAIYLLGGPLSGWLATRAFGWTAVAGAVTLFALFPIVARLDREPPAKRAEATFERARHQLRAIVRSRAMWAASGLLFLVHVSPGLQTPLFFYQTDVLGLGPVTIGRLRLLGGAGLLLGAAVYGYLCKRVPLRTSLIVGLLLNASSTLLYLRYDSLAAAAVIDFTVSALGTLALLPLYDLAARATPAGSESFGFGLMMSVRNLALFVVSDPLGSRLYSRHHIGFKQLVWISAASTLVVLLFVPLIPRALLASREQSADRGA